MKAIKIKTSNSIFFCQIDENMEYKKNENVIVEINQNEYFAKVFDNKVIEINNGSLCKIIRKATSDDIKVNEKNKSDSIKALGKARKFSKELGLDMNILNAIFTFNRNQLIISFTADERIDFRELAKKIAAIYKTRIELRQIGVRDKAKEIGGLGPCGRFLCCNLFLNEFESVSINMAKNQYISLKPDKVNGICGRLLCCLNYEDSQYTDMKQKFPMIGKIFKYNGENYKVITQNLLTNSIVAEKKDKSQIVLSLDEYESIK